MPSVVLGSMYLSSRSSRPAHGIVIPHAFFEISQRFTMIPIGGDEGVRGSIQNESYAPITLGEFVAIANSVRQDLKQNPSIIDPFAKTHR